MMESLKDFNQTLDGMRTGRYVVNLDVLAVKWNRLAADIEKLEAAQQSAQQTNRKATLQMVMSGITQVIPRSLMMVYRLAANAQTVSPQTSRPERDGAVVRLIQETE